MIDESGLQQSEMLTPKITCWDKKTNNIVLYTKGEPSCRISQEQ
jgi:hypothetical protein